MKPSPPTLGAAIESDRKARPISQQEFAKAFGVTQQAVSRWEAGTGAPRPKRLRAIAAFFGEQSATARLLGYGAPDGASSRLLLDLPPAALARLASLKRRTEAVSDAEVVKNALRIHQMLLDERDAGRRLMLRDGAGELVELMLI